MAQKASYVNFISDEDLFECISEVYAVYHKKLENLNYDEFVKNKLDPFKMMFDLNIQGLTIEEWVVIESNRQIERAVSNAIGYFHEALIDKISSFKKVTKEEKKKYKIDLINPSLNTYVEVKNKHNTVKGEDKKSIFEKLEKIVLENEGATCIFLNILGTESKSEAWKFSTGKDLDKKYYSNDNIIHCTGDQFYSFITKDENAFARLCQGLPLAIRDFESRENTGKSYKEMTEELQSKLILSIRKNAEIRGRTMEKELVWDGLNKSNYLGFHLKK